ncbi:hypothetical protein JW766_01715 [Candidatus Dojkabacteria bacterium]|nr:hypothetical protein [Candidatus Dojkabacteria bacterium]
METLEAKKSWVSVPISCTGCRFRTTIDVGYIPQTETLEAATARELQAIQEEHSQVCTGSGTLQVSR